MIQRFYLVRLWLLLFLVVMGVGLSCRRRLPTPLFVSLSPDSTGIHFANTVTENDSINILDNEYVYNGGGVATGDLNGDGLADIFFTGNRVYNRLYLNLGHLKFKDITQAAGLKQLNTWSTGVSLVDINADGRTDILVCNSIYKDSSRLGTYLYINQGNNVQGIPTFKESAAEYGLNDKGHNVQAAWLDFDHDGDLDLVFITNIIQDYPNQFKPKTHDGKSPTVDKLYRNDWDQRLKHPVFHDVSFTAEIREEGYSHGVSIADFNGDGWDDIYISNDYLSNDLLYINNRNGTFTNQIDDYFNHQSFSAMGNDVADINNDGLPDIFTTEMLPVDNKRKKLMLGGNNYQNLILDSLYHFQREYVRNTLQLNQGNLPDSSAHPVFSEIAMLSGIHQTDWSWCPLWADFDNDGKKDLLVTNGFPKDVSDHDFAAYRSSYAYVVSTKKQTLSQIPAVKIPNFIFKNLGNLAFKDQTDEWGMNIPSFSNGAAYADLDNDGDLDLVINNIDMPAFIFQNTSYEQGLGRQHHYLGIKLVGPQANGMGIGTKVYCYAHGGQMQCAEETLCHGYLSNSTNILHFGLGLDTIIDSVRIIWPAVSVNGISAPSQRESSIYKYQRVGPIHADQVIEVNIKNALMASSPFTIQPKVKSWLVDSRQARNMHYSHRQNDFIDFNLQHTLPHKLSQYGPGIAVGDINGDGLEDFFVSSAAGQPSSVFYQLPSGRFEEHLFQGQVGPKVEADLGAILFDADGDGDLDLYIASGGFEHRPGSDAYLDRLYLNNGKGKFTLARGAIPRLTDSKQCVRVADYDGDGKLDILVATRVVPGTYPEPGPAYILHNETTKGGTVRFKEVSSVVCPMLSKAGLITDALWTDFNNDGYLDFILCGEWSPVRFFAQRKGKFVEVTQESGIGGRVGWWNSLAAGDFDGDGDIDYVVGNLGLNTPFQASDAYPVSIYAKDFDHNGTMDPIIETYVRDSTGGLNPYPYPSRDDIIRQILPLKKRFLRYGEYGKARISDLFNQAERIGALHYKANWFYSSYLENLGHGHFKIQALPIEAQFAPIFGLLPYDVDGDGHLDLLLTGNDEGGELLSGAQDALQGLTLRGDGKGGFKAVSLAHAGLYIPGDGRAMSLLVDGKGKGVILASQNKGPLKCFELREALGGSARPPRIISLGALDAYALIGFSSGRVEKKEFYYGSTYLSQSSRQLVVPTGAIHLTLVNSRHQKRVVF